MRKKYILTGHCARAICLAIFLLMYSGCRGLKVENVQTVQSADWREDSGNASRNRAVSAEFRFPLQQAWHSNTAGAFGPGSPLMVGETIVLGTRRGDLFLVDSESGTKLGSKHFGDSIEGSLLIVNGIVYIPSNMGKKSIIAYDLSEGKELWTIQGAPFEAGFVAVDDVLVGIDISGVVWGRDILTGEEVWSFKMEDGSSGHSTPIELSDGSVVLAGDRGLMLKINPASGAIMWKHVLAGPMYSSPTESNGVLYVPTTRGVLLALRSVNGEQVWRAELGNSRVRIASPASEAENLYVGTSNGQFFSLNRITGKIEWQFDGPHAFTAAPLVTDRYVFVGTMGRILYAFDRETSDVAWSTELDGRIKSAMAARNGELFVLAEPRHLYKFTSSEGPDENVD